MSEAAKYYWRDPVFSSPPPQRKPEAWQYRFKSPVSGQPVGPWRNMVEGDKEDFFDLYPDCFETRPLYAERSETLTGKEFYRGWNEAISAAHALLTQQAFRAHEEAGDKRKGELDRCLLSTRANVLQAAANDLGRLKGDKQ